MGGDRHDNALANIVDFVAKFLPEDELRVWIADVRATLPTYVRRRMMADFEPWRDRTIEWVKPYTNSKGEECFRGKDGKTYPAESFKRQYEKLEPEKETQ